MGNELNLKFVKPGAEVQITEAEWQEGAGLWRHPVIGQVVNASVSYAEIVKWASWKDCVTTVSQIKPGLFLFDFFTEEERFGAINKNWTFYHRETMVFKPWNTEIPLDQVCMDSTPVWIQLPGLQPRLWTSSTLSKIASFVGVPLATDRMTAQRTRLDYARILVDVKHDGQFPVEIPIKGPDGTAFVHKVVYEWKVKKCQGCGLLGHEEYECRRKAGNRKDGRGEGTQRQLQPTINKNAAQSTDTVQVSDQLVDGAVTKSVPAAVQVRNDAVKGAASQVSKPVSPNAQKKSDKPGSPRPAQSTQGAALNSGLGKDAAAHDAPTVVDSRGIKAS